MYNTYKYNKVILFWFSGSLLPKKKLVFFFLKHAELIP